MKVLHVVQHLHKLSGVSVYCAEMCEALARAGVSVDVAVQDLSDANQIPSCAGVRRLQVSEVCAGRCDYDLVHIHNLWTPVLHKASVWAAHNRVPVVWSLHGTLSPWAFKYKRWKKLPVWWLSQKNDLKRAKVLHVTSANEAEWTQGFGFENVVNIPMGTHLPEGKELRCSERPHVLLFVGRIAPVKALPKLIEAWSRLPPNDWRLRIVGVEDFPGYTDSLRALAVNVGVGAHVEFPGPKFGGELAAEYGEASALALVSETENFGAVVADAMAHLLPVITAKGTPWREVAEDGCGWWVDNSVETLAKTLGELISLSPQSRETMGSRGRELVRTKYAWPAIAQKMMMAYKDVLGGAE